MTTFLLLSVLAAALLHASWNALVKISADRFLSISIHGWSMGVIIYFKYRKTAGQNVRQYWKQGLIGGLMQLLSYGIVIWAMSHASIVLVAALRETSVLFAMLLSVFILREPFSKMRLLACLVIVAGVICTKLG
ncbi:DMT family transporter [Xenorhabdus bovienii]|uniref:EamA family transporter n=1 Tax=Xenorhabdus bovienii TaxID=40576 RepID=UPI0023B23738|nr:EamA family transporter [Xenorhabdus bovienii]MDE9555274.1 DMT family transporter [Xenorhabdus bovienii]